MEFVVVRALDVDYATWRARLLSWLRTTESSELFQEKLQWENLFSEVREKMNKGQFDEAI